MLPGILLHDFPETELGWTYDNRKKKSNNSLDRSGGGVFRNLIRPAKVE